MCHALSQHDSANGECMSTRMCVCIAGDRYEGEWQDGKEHGAGTAVAADGSSFYGTWQNGKRHGEGVSSLDRLLQTCWCSLLQRVHYLHAVLLTGLTGSGAGRGVACLMLPMALLGIAKLPCEHLRKVLS